MNFKTLFHNICLKKSFLCVGLDPDLELLPKHLLDTEDPVFEFNNTISPFVLGKPIFGLLKKPGLIFIAKLSTRLLKKLGLRFLILQNISSSPKGLHVWHY